MNEPGRKTFLILATDGDSLTNFRGPLIRHLVSRGHRVVCVSIESAEQMSDRISALGAEYIQVAGSRVGIGVLSGLNMINSYKKLLRRVKPDICFFYMSKPTAFGSLAAVLTGTKHFNVLVNGLENAYYRTGLKDFAVRCVMSSAYRFSARFADNVFFQNSDDYAYFKTHRLLSKDNATVVGGSGVDMEHYKKTPVPPEPVFLSVARLLKSKGIREYLDAATALKAEMPGARFLIVGGLDSNDESITQAELDDYISKADIEYCGYSPDVRPFLERCSVFVLASYHEGLPRSVIEAMSTGRAVITTDVPGCRETVIDGENGFLVPVRDSGALKDKMKILASDRSLREKMGEASYRICLEKFEVSRVNRIMYDAMMNKFTK